MPRKRTVGGVRRVTRGGRRLLRYMQSRKLGATEFAGKLGVSRMALARVMNGERWKYISVDFALACQDGTDGYVKIEDFASLTANGEDEVPTPARRTGTDG